MGDDVITFIKAYGVWFVTYCFQQKVLNAWSEIADRFLVLFVCVMCITCVKPNRRYLSSQRAALLWSWRNEKMKTTAARRRRSDAVMKSGGSYIEGRDEYECHSEELADARQQMATTSSKCRCGVDISLDHRLNKAVLLKKENKLLAAAEILEGIDCNYFAPVHHIITKEAGILKKILRDCSSNTKDIGWTKRVEKRGKKHFSVESKLKRCQNNECTDNYDMLTFRVVTSIEASMLVPVLAVLNESDLFSSWAPKFKVPRFGVSKSERLLQLDRCSQVALLEVDHPWPLGMREMIVKAIACEDISTSPSRIVSSLQTMDVENDGK